MAAKKVLIVEDDSALASALSGAVKKVGYEAVVCPRPDEALGALDRDSFRIVFIDCLLPHTSGMDLAKSIRMNFDSRILPIVLMSGIFTDKQMIKEMVHDAAAIDFLKKPFEVNEVLKFLEKDSGNRVDESLARSLFSLPDRAGANPSQVVDIIAKITKIHGYELPILLASAVENSFTGVINLLSDKGEKTRITMNRGSIYGVESPDVQSFLGKLLVMNKWVLAEDLETVLKQASEQKLGARLIEQSLISPHAVTEVMEEQMVVRVGKIIQDQNYIVNFEGGMSREDSAIISSDDPSIDPEEFYSLLDQWIRDRVSGDWLNRELGRWKEYGFRLGPGHDITRREYGVLILKQVPEIGTELEKAGTLAALQQTFENKLSEVNKAFYYLLCLRCVMLAEKMGQMSEAEQVARLQKLWSQIKDGNLIEAFGAIGIRKGMDLNEIRAVYGDFIQRVLGTPPASDANPALKSVHESVQKRLGEAYELFMDSKKLIDYENNLEAGKISKRSEAQAKLEEAKKFLSIKQYGTAIVLINKAQQIFPNLDYVGLFTAWAKLNMLTTSKNKQKDLGEIERILVTVPPEEKNTAIGNFVQGLAARVRGEVAVARNFFETAIAIDKNMIEARRELNSMPTAAAPKKPLDLLHGDLGQVLGSIFKKS